MAWLEQHSTSGRFKICFRWGGRQLKKSLKTTNHDKAEATRVRLEENIVLVERGRLDIPAGADIATFLLSDGKIATCPKKEPPPKPLMFGELRDAYVEAQSHGALEENSLLTVKMHLRHFAKTFGESFAVQTLDVVHLQKHIDRRARQKGIRKKPISPTTLKKEVTTLRACWNWGVSARLVSGSFPSNKSLRYPKSEEKPHFRTRAEIERQISLGGLTKVEIADLWDCLFLTISEIDDLLSYVQMNASQPFVYSMIAFAAHTGARRSEMLRARIGDLDLEGRTVVLREKKRVRGVRSTRRVPLSPFLVDVLRDWLKSHAGGQDLFCQAAVVRSKIRRTGAMPITRDEAQDHFRRTMRDSKWKVLRGWHVFRHSFCSNCAAAGVDQRLIDAWVGHTTDDMRRRYRHLVPNQEQQVIQQVFGRTAGTGQASSCAGSAASTFSEPVPAAV